MKKIVFIVLLLLIVGNGLKAQLNNKGLDSAYYKGKVYHFGFSGFNAKGDSVFTSMQIEAEFPGGADGWRAYLQQNLNTSVGGKYIKIPKGDASAKATVIISFLVDKYGNVDSVKADSTYPANVHRKIVAEAVRVIKGVPQWIPAWQNGKNVAYRARQQITFVATKD